MTTQTAQATRFATPEDLWKSLTPGGDRCTVDLDTEDCRANDDGTCPACPNAKDR